MCASSMVLRSNSIRSVPLALAQFVQHPGNAAIGLVRDLWEKQRKIQPDLLGHLFVSLDSVLEG